MRAKLAVAERRESNRAGGVASIGWIYRISHFKLFASYFSELNMTIWQRLFEGLILFLINLVRTISQDSHFWVGKHFLQTVVNRILIKKWLSSTL